MFSHTGSGGLRKNPVPMTDLQVERVCHGPVFFHLQKKDAWCGNSSCRALGERNSMHGLDKELRVHCATKRAANPQRILRPSPCRAQKQRARGDEADTIKK